MRTITRRTAVAACATLIFSGTAHAGPMEDLAAAAAKKGPVIWYESSPPDAIGRVAAAFNRTYPGIRVQFIRNTGGNSLAAKVIQEVQAGGVTASLITGDVNHVEALNARGLLVKRDWAELGVDKRFAPTPYAIATAYTIFSVIWNTNKVGEDAAPKTWDDLLQPVWKGRLGHWVRAPELANLAFVRGTETMRDYTAKLAAQQPALFPSTYPLAQQVAAGEVDMAFMAHQAALAPIAQGAPIGERFLDPTPYNTLYSGVVAKGGNPEGAQVLAAWLTTREGATAYEDATGRGNPLLEGTKAAASVAGRRLSEWPFTQASTYEALEAELAETLGRDGRK